MQLQDKNVFKLQYVNKCYWIRKGWKACWRGGGGGRLREDDGTCYCSVGLCTSKQTTPLNTVKQTLKIVS